MSAALTFRCHARRCLLTGRTRSTASWRCWRPIRSRFSPGLAYLAAAFAASGHDAQAASASQTALVDGEELSHQWRGACWKKRSGNDCRTRELPGRSRCCIRHNSKPGRTVRRVGSPGSAKGNACTTIDYDDLRSRQNESNGRKNVFPLSNRRPARRRRNGRRLPRRRPPAGP